MATRGDKYSGFDFTRELLSLKTSKQVATYISINSTFTGM
jgi:hypothetical protein